MGGAVRIAPTGPKRGAVGALLVGPIERKRSGKLCGLNKNRGRLRRLVLRGQGPAVDQSPVVGSMMARTSEMRLAGKPPSWACFSIIALSGAM